MRFALTAACGLLVVTPAAPAADLTALKTGTWEVTTTSPMLPKPDVDRSCVTRADLAEFAKNGGADDADCKFVKPPTRSGNTWVAEKACEGGRARFEIVADSAEQVRGTITMTMGRGAKPMEIRFAGRWLSAGCGRRK